MGRKAARSTLGARPIRCAGVQSTAHNIGTAAPESRGPSATERRVGRAPSPTTVAAAYFLKHLSSIVVGRAQQPRLREPIGTAPCGMPGPPDNDVSVTTQRLVLSGRRSRRDIGAPPSPGYCTDRYCTVVARRSAFSSGVAGHSHQILFSTMLGQGKSAQPPEQPEWPKQLFRGHFLLTAVDRRTPLFAGTYCTVIARHAPSRGDGALSRAQIAGHI
jgi:hypothetical protein